MRENTRKKYRIIIRAAERGDYYEHNTDKISFIYNSEWISYKSKGGVEFIVPKTNIIMIRVNGD
jgi:predicted transcriptional regulator of viral defense system